METSWAVVRTLCFTAGRLGSIPARGTKIPQAAQHIQKKKKKCALSMDMYEYYSAMKNEIMHLQQHEWTYYA